MQAAVPPVVLDTPSNSVAESERLSEALSLLYDYPPTRDLIIRAIKDGYTFKTDPNLKYTAIHCPTSPWNTQPEIILHAGGSAMQYAKRLCHELKHYGFQLSDRTYGDYLSPQGDMQQRLAEDAAVCAMTADDIYHISLGIGTVSGAAYPELWEDFIQEDVFTGRSYLKNIDKGREAALSAAFNAFYNLTNNGYYQYSLVQILKHPNLLNPNCFRAQLDPTQFASYLPQGYEGLANHIAHTDLASPRYFNPPAGVMAALPARFRTQPPKIPMQSNVPAYNQLLLAA